MPPSNSIADQPYKNILNRSANLDQDSFDKMSEDVGAENLEYERYQARLRRANAMQDKIFEMHYKNHYLP